MLVNIPIEKLHPNPNNPRKDLGDLSELAESIKVHGVLQNLTVVPSNKEYWEKLNEDGKHNYLGDSTVIIGHRRLAAAKLAGLEELLCVVEDMDEKTQIATMLLENIQRNDLTIYEQAQGFQMMMDLGESVSSITESTGFSETTVRRRVNLLELDKKLFEEADARGATLEDYAELNKINDIGTRNKVLKKVGTKDFDMELRKAVDKEKKEANIALIRSHLEQFATEIESNDHSTHQYVGQYWLGNSDFDLERPEDADETEYFFTVSDYSINLYKPKPTTVELDPEDVAREAARAERDALKNKIDSLFEQAFKLRVAFVKQLKIPKKCNAAFDDMVLSSMVFGKSIEEDVFREIFDVEKPFKQRWDSDKNKETFEECVEKMLSDGMDARKLLYAVAYSCIDSEDSKCVTWSCEYEPNNKLEMAYRCLESLGYVKSTEESALLDGTHELYRQKVECRKCCEKYSADSSNLIDGDLCRDCATHCELCHDSTGCDGCCKECEKDKCTGRRQMCRKSERVCRECRRVEYVDDTTEAQNWSEPDLCMRCAESEDDGDEPEDLCQICANVEECEDGADTIVDACSRFEEKDDSESTEDNS